MFAFAALREADFVNLVIKMRSCLESKWNSSKIDALEAEHCVNFVLQHSVSNNSKVFLNIRMIQHPLMKKLGVVDL